MKKHIKFFSGTEGITYLDKTMRLSLRFLFGGMIMSVFVGLLVYLFPQPELLGSMYIITLMGFVFRGHRGLSKHLHEGSLKKDEIHIPCGWDGGAFHGWKSNVVATVLVFGVGLAFGYDILMLFFVIMASSMLLGLGLCYFFLERKHGVKLYCYKYK